MNRSGRTGLKEGAVVAVRGQPHQREREREKNNSQNGVEGTALGKEGNVIHR
jgi:hypothetical protein